VVTQEEVLQALSTVLAAEPGDAPASQPAVRDVRICDGNVAFDLVLSASVEPRRAEIQRQCRAAVQRIPGVKAVNVRVKGASASPAGGSGLVPGVRHIIAIASGKGGVGKSTVATNLALALAEDGAATGLLDADVYGPSIPLMMGVRRPPFVQDGKMLPIEQHGVRLMSLGFLMPEDSTPAVWRGPMVGGAVRQMLADVAWGDLDYLLVDLPPGTGDAQLTLAQSVPLTGVVIVLTSQEVAVQIASKALAMFQKLNVPVLGIVENMAAFACPHCGAKTAIFTQGGGEAAAERLGVPFLGSIPLDPAVVQHGDTGQPTVAAIPDSPQADAFRQVARRLVTRLDEESADREGAPRPGAGDPLGGLAERFRR
jgi:ATP-binding protein involved in chromosome partitioning